MEHATGISATILEEGGVLKLIFASPGRGSLIVPLKVTPTRLPELRESFGIGLRSFVGILSEDGRVEKDKSAALNALRQLYAVGTELGFGIFGSEISAVTDYLRAAVPSWQQALLPEFEKSYARPNFVLKGAFEFPLPLEFVPLFDTSEPEFILQDIAVIAARFPVFSTIFSRSPESVTRSVVTTPNVSPDGVIENLINNQPGLLVRLFLNESLPAAGREQGFFANSPGVEVRGPWPAHPQANGTFLADFSDRVLSAVVSDDAGSVDRDHIQHFVCHCDTRNSLSGDHTLKLGFRRSQAFWTSFREFPLRLGDLGGRIFGRTRGQTGVPIVFLNACGSSKITPEGVLSFPDIFLDAGSNAVIGTEVAVPDAAAAQFSEIFYKEMMAGLPLGEAMFSARFHLLQMLNPIGAIYSAYAHSHLRLRNIVN